MQKKLNEIIKTAKEAVDKSASVSEINENRVRFLGKKGEITAMMKELGKLPADAKKEAGQIINAARSKVEKLIAEQKKEGGGETSDYPGYKRSCRHFQKFRIFGL